MPEDRPVGKIDHIGFCLGQYDSEVCFDCPTEAECLELWRSEQREKEKAVK